eukprot:Opistho-1_new@54361
MYDMPLMEIGEFMRSNRPANWTDPNNPDYLQLPTDLVSNIYGMLSSRALLAQFFSKAVVSVGSFGDSDNANAQTTVDPIGETMSIILQYPMLNGSADARRIVSLIADFAMALGTTLLQKNDADVFVQTTPRNVILANSAKLYDRLEQMDPTAVVPIAKGILTNHQTADDAGTAADMVFTGSASIDEINFISKWRGDTGLGSGGIILPLDGYEGTQFPPNLRNSTWTSPRPRHDRYGVFHPELRRKVDMVYSTNVRDANNVTVNRFLADPSTFVRGDNRTGAMDYGIYVDGLQNLAAVYGYPAVDSFPHFLFTSMTSELFRNVTGMKPDAAKHQSYYEVELNTGRTMSSARRVMVSVLLEADQILLRTGAQLRDGTTLVPHFWTDVRTYVPAEAAASFKTSLNFSMLASTRRLLQQSTTDGNVPVNITKAPLMPGDTTVPTTTNIEVPSYLVSDIMALREGFRYRVCFRAKVGTLDADFLYACSNGLSVDSTPPLAGIVCDGTRTCRVPSDDVDFQVSTTQSARSW